MTVARIEYILKPGGIEPVDSGRSVVLNLEEVMRGTPAALKAWLELTPEEIPFLLVKDMEVDLIVAAEQYIQRLNSGKDDYEESIVEAQWVW
jgi:hypothetical protein